MLKMFIFPLSSAPFAGTVLGFMMPNTVIAKRLYTMVFLANYAPKGGRI